MKMGRYGYGDSERLKHCAAAMGEVRCTIAYIVPHQTMWHDILDEYGTA